MVRPSVRLTSRTIGASMAVPSGALHRRAVGAGFQNASSHSRAIDQTVSRLTARATAATTILPGAEHGANHRQLGDEAGERGNAGQREQRHHRQARDRRMCAIQTAERAQVGRPPLPQKQAADEEQGR